MAFFEDMKNKAQELGKISRINGRIKDLNRTIKDTYLQIGQTIYSEHKDSPLPEVEALINKINDSFAEIKKYEAELEELKAPKGIECPNCGTILEEDAAFCTNCGSKIEPAEAKAEGEEAPKNVCPSCNNEVPEGTAFCSHCGAKLN